MTDLFNNPADGRSVSERRGTVGEVLAAFGKLGLMSFGGPVAHLSYFREEFVEKRRWLDDAAYADLVALCQFLPGPASSQVAFALGMRRAGLVGAFAASAGFTLPSAVAMILFAYGVGTMGDLHAAGWLHGLKLAAVAVVAQAVWGMGRKLCPDRARLSLAAGAAVVVLSIPGALAQIAAIAAGAVIGWSLYRGEPSAAVATTAGRGKHPWAAGVLGLFFVLLVGLPFLARVTGNREVQVFDGFYRAGSLVFGGGHVVLPLLRAEVVPPGWVSNDAFLAGYGAVQAVPGPLFTFAAYLGTIIGGTTHAWAMGLGCLLAVFLPAWMLIGGALPFWETWRTRAGAQAILRGANAAVVGVLLAALYTPVWTSGVTKASDVATVVVAFILLEAWKVPAWLVVLLAAAAGQWTL